MPPAAMADDVTAVAAAPSEIPRLESGVLELRPHGKFVELANENARNSPLLRLPGEIRNRIYAFAIGGQTLKVEGNNGKHVFGLLQVSRQIYIEAGLLVFKENTFSAREPLGMKDWLSSKISVDLDFIRSIELGKSFLDFKMGHSSGRGDFVWSMRRFVHLWSFSGYFKPRKLAVTLGVPFHWQGTLREWEEERDELKKILEGLNPGVAFVVGADHGADLEAWYELVGPDDQEDADEEDDDYDDYDGNGSEGEEYYKDELYMNGEE